MKSQVDVYRNLDRRVWSIRDRATGLVVEHRDTLVMRGVEFVVQPAGHKRALREGKKNVHAFARGEIMLAIPRIDRGQGWLRVWYDLKRGCFWATTNGQTVMNLDEVSWVVFDDEGGAWVRVQDLGDGKDFQQAAVYTAETAAGSFKEFRFDTVDECQIWLTLITVDPWFVRVWGPNIHVRVEPGPGQTHALGWREDPNTCCMKVPKHLRTPPTLLHELAHGLEPFDEHGPMFTRTLLFLFEQVLGPAKRDLLVKEFENHNVVVGPPLGR